MSSLRLTPQDHVGEVLAIYLDLAQMGDWNERRTYFRRHRHRVFDPAFLPALTVVADVATKGPDVGEVGAAVLWFMLEEITELLRSVEGSEMGQRALVTELLFNMLATGAKGENPFSAVGRLYKERALPTRDRAAVASEFEGVLTTGRSFRDSLPAAAEGLDAFLEMTVMVQAVVAALDAIADLRGQPVTPALSSWRAIPWRGDLNLLMAALHEAAPSDRLMSETLLLMSAGLGIDRVQLETYIDRGAPESDSATEETHRQKLASLGPAIVVPLLEATAEKLGSLFTSTDALWMGWAPHFAAMVFTRAVDLVSELLSAEQEPVRDMTSVLLATSLEHEDLDVRRLAASMCGLRGISEAAVTDFLILAVKEHSDVLVMTLAAAALSGYESVADELRRHSGDFLLKMHRVASNQGPEEDDRDDSDASARESKLVIAKAKLIVQLPGLIGLDRARRVASAASGQQPSL